MKTYVKGVPSNIDVEDYFKYYCKDEDASEVYYNDILDVQHQLEEEVEQLQRREERLEEQLMFAEELVSMIQEVCKKHTRAKEIKKHIGVLIENSHFEL